MVKYSRYLRATLYLHNRILCKNLFYYLIYKCVYAKNYFSILKKIQYKICTQNNSNEYYNII